MHIGFAAEAGADDEDVEAGEEGFEFGVDFFWGRVFGEDGVDD